jgi:hypothetical protein
VTNFFTKQEMAGAALTVLANMTGNSALNRFYMKLHNYSQTHNGEKPEQVYMLWDEFKDIMRVLQTHGTDLKGGHLFGVKVAVVDFADDPLFKRLQAMARLVGAEVDCFEADNLVVAEFSKDGAGWRYIGGHSPRLVPFPLTREEHDVFYLSNQELEPSVGAAAGHPYPPVHRRPDDP